jgi:hypothetical protein
LSTADLLEHIAEAMDAKHAKQRVVGVKSSLAEERFNLAVLGGFKRGKSTFVNALLGADLLPTGIVPLTSIVTKIVYGEDKGALVKYQDGRGEYIELADLGRYITEKGNPGNELKVAAVEVIFDSPKLKGGVNIVDTPGTGSTFTENTRVTHEFIEHADAGVFILSADPPIGENELDFLRLIKRSVDHMFFVQNKIDRLTEAEWREAMDFSASVIKSALGLGKVTIYPLSSKNALEAKNKGDTKLLIDSRLDAFERGLESFLVSGKGDAILHNARTRLLQVAYDMNNAVALELAAADRPIKVLESKLQWLREQNALAAQRMKEAAYLIDGNEKEIASKVDEYLVTFLESEGRRISERLKRGLDNINRSLRRNEYLSAVANEMIISITEALTPFIEEEQSRTSKAFETTTKRFQNEANDIIGSVHRMAAATFDLSLPRTMGQLTLDSKTKFWLDIKPVISFDLLFVGEIQSALPRAMLRRVAEKKALGMIQEELENNARRYRYDLVSRLSKSSERLKREFQNNLKEVVEATESALVSGIDRKRRTTLETAERTLLLTDIRAKLDRVIAGLDANDARTPTS